MSETPSAETPINPGETANANGPATDASGLDPVQAQLAEVQERYVRLYADFENFKKRAARERDEVRRATTESVLGRLLPVLDTFEMAMLIVTVATADGATLRAKVSVDSAAARGDRVGLSFDAAAVSLFDKASGRALRTARDDTPLSARSAQPSAPAAKAAHAGVRHG